MAEILELYEMTVNMPAHHGALVFYGRRYDLQDTAMAQLLDGEREIVHEFYATWNDHQVNGQSEVIAVFPMLPAGNYRIGKYSSTGRPYSDRMITVFPGQVTTERR